MSNAVRTLKAFRPSAYRDEDVLTERVVAIVRARNVIRYATMVREGLRLFECDVPSADEPAAGSPGAVG